MKAWLKKVWLVVYFFFGAEVPCAHTWRPCIAVLHTWGNERRPARVCDRCKDWEPLTPEQFFAEFGENFYALAAKENLEAGNK